MNGLIVDLFSGGGGTTVGLEFGLNRYVDIAINHKLSAVLMHELNSPSTKHYCEDIFSVDPKEACRGRKVDLLWASPDCTHFSKARGGTPVRKDIRGLAWVVIRWANAVRPSVIMLENVEEILSWGPLRAKRDKATGRVFKLDGSVALPGEVVAAGDQQMEPDPKRSGQTWNMFIGVLRFLGYDVQWRILKACDFGAATTRKRLFLVARCDGKRIVWPEPTYGQRDSEAVKSGKLKPYRAAADFIDFKIDTPSIFNRKKPLAEATQKRIVRGIDKFVIKSGKPYIIPVGYGERKGQSPRVNDLNDPLGTVVSTTKHNFVEPKFLPFIADHQHENIGSRIDDPHHTICSVNKSELVVSSLTKFQQNSIGQDPANPLDTIMAGATRFAAVGAKLSPVVGSNNFVNAGSRGDSPIGAITTQGNHHCLYTPLLTHYHSATSESEARGTVPDAPLPVVDTSNRHALAVGMLSKAFGGNYKGAGSELNHPIDTITAKDHNNLVSAHISKYYQGDNFSDAAEPMPTATAKDRMAVVASTLSILRRNGDGRSVRDPIPTITAGGGHIAECRTYLVKYDGGVFGYWQQIRELLNKYGGYHLAEDEIILFEIAGDYYYLSDIGMRMLTPRELYLCQGFPADYVIDRGSDGRQLTKTQQVEMVGNSVCPQVPAALARANFALQDYGISSMDQLHKIAV